MVETARDKIKTANFLSKIYFENIFIDAAVGVIEIAKSQSLDTFLFFF